MRIYIKDKPLRIKRPEEVKDHSKFDLVINVDDIILNEKAFRGNMLITNASQGMIKSLLFILHHSKLKGFKSVTLITPEYEETVNLIKGKFKIIKAAGGVVEKDNKVLMIHRLGMWDFPKGKIEGKESVQEGAKREVEEECNVKVRVKDQVCVTWHTYVRGGKDILKKTSWFLMDSLDDSKMKPQLDEDIDEVKWMNSNEVNVALYNTYRSIQHVYKKYKKKRGKKAV
ncbi:NUDIX domain-containing protein [uncultured Roseivirga sp.]|uniref:NUDIX hydrolase n=1 Tax=uncultured Roseivirga sp. TaxID=543088 RepID=UPI0030DB5832|tara:strand:+ start:308981 stop:309664 length:684 start_codon:yes stop_codon:yes gene_type:complete